MHTHARFDCPALRSNATAAEFSEWSIKFAGLKGGVVLPKLYAPQTLEYPHPVIDSAVMRTDIQRCMTLYGWMSDSRVDRYV